MLHADMLAIGIQVNVTTLLTGKPGIGKTAVVRAVTRQIEERKYGGKGFPFVVTNAAQGMAEDIGGAQVPNHENKTMEGYIMGAIKTFVEHKKGVHLCDEYGSANNNYRAAMLSVNEGRLYGDHHIPGVAVVCCMNPPDIATNGADMTPPESNRFFWLSWDLEDSAWFDYMLGGLGAAQQVPILPDKWEETHLPKAKSLIVSFLKRNPKRIHDMPAPEKSTQPWPSPRSWEYAAKMLAATRACGFDIASNHVHAAVCGCIGTSVGDEFFAWVKNMDLPDPEVMLADPENVWKIIGDRHDRAMVALESMAAAASEKSHKDFAKRWDAAWKALDPVIQSHQDRAEPAAKILARNKPPGANFPPQAGVLLNVRRQVGISSSGVAR